MSETAISSQINATASPSQSGSASSMADTNDTVKTQASEFDEVLTDNTEALETDPQQLQSQETSLENLNLLLNINPLLANQSILATGGNTLPSELSLDDILQANVNAGVKNNTPLEGEYKLSLTQLNSTVNPGGKLALNSAINPLDVNTILDADGLPIDDDFLTAQLSANFTEKNLPNSRLLNTQLFNQFMNQAVSTQQTNIDNTVLVGAAPGIIVNQSLSLHSSEAILPAITVSPDNPQLNAQLGERINWMVNNSIQRAEIRLDPPELGNLDIRLNLAKDNQASILIHVSNASAKEAIESAIPRLREMFEQQGLDLVNVDVSQQNLQHQQSAFEQFDQNNSQPFGSDSIISLHSEDKSSSDEILAVSNLHTKSNHNLLDIFA